MLGLPGEGVIFFKEIELVIEVVFFKVLRGLAHELCLLFCIIDLIYFVDGGDALGECRLLFLVIIEHVFERLRLRLSRSPFQQLPVDLKHPYKI